MDNILYCVLYIRQLNVKRKYLRIFFYTANIYRYKQTDEANFGTSVISIGITSVFLSIKQEAIKTREIWKNWLKIQFISNSRCSIWSTGQKPE